VAVGHNSHFTINAECGCLPKHLTAFFAEKWQFMIVFYPEHSPFLVG
jgi:hypothetical protein